MRHAEKEQKSTIRVKDFLHEILSAASSRPSRTLMTIAGTILGIATFIGIIGFTQSAAGQISEKFNTLEATQLHLTDNLPKTSQKAALSFPTDSLKRITALNGVKSASLYWKVDSDVHPLSISTKPTFGSQNSTGFAVYAADNGLFDFARNSMKIGIPFNSFHVQHQSHVAVLGEKTAQHLGINDLTLPHTIYLNSEPFSVLGILHSVTELPEIDTSVVIPDTTSLKLYGKPTATSPAQMMLRTDMGAARLIANQAPYALRPDAPQNFLVDAPQDWSKATRGVQSSLSGLLVGLAVLALLIGCVGIANSTLTSIFERIPEIGLRRALGARPRHILAQILGETALLGGIGGLIGMSLGLAAILGVCFVQSWTPVIDPMLLLLGPLLGILTGTIAGIYPAVKASRISPITALQHL
ncbi:MAG: ABC transporter permease [Bifidobacteriaceae bacterium]|jgi:putative ABC transport system permease protein|nr:ABC transporter permease [Bifidobacteriaceae bacterium]MCI1978595.1 ABC transporter permease [Bifidobacteriaceae bacterium]